MRRPPLRHGTARHRAAPRRTGSRTVPAGTGAVACSTTIETYGVAMPTLLLFAAAREAAGTGRVEIDGATVGDVLDAAVERFGERLAHVLAHSKVWLDGDPATRDQPVGPTGEVAILPPVSGG